MSTFPSGSNVAVCVYLAVVMLPVATKTPFSTVVLVVPAVPVVVPGLVASPVVLIVPAVAPVPAPPVASDVPLPPVPPAS